MKIKFEAKVSTSSLILLGALTGVAFLVSESRAGMLQRWRGIMAKTAEEIARLDVAIDGVGNAIVAEMQEIQTELEQANERVSNIDLSPQIERLSALGQKVSEFTAAAKANNPNAPAPAPVTDTSAGAATGSGTAVNNTGDVNGGASAADATAAPAVEPTHTDHPGMPVGETPTSEETQP